MYKFKNKIKWVDLLHILYFELYALVEQTNITPIYFFSYV